MDKQNRLTKWSELELGARYQWLKGGVGGPFFTLVEIDEQRGFIGMLKDGNDRPDLNYNWQNRFRKVV